MENGSKNPWLLLIRLDERTERMEMDIKDIRTYQKEQNGKVAGLQRWQNKVTGALGLLALLIPVVAVLVSRA